MEALMKEKADDNFSKQCCLLILRLFYMNPYDKDSNGRQYCSHYGSYYYPRERQGCLSYKG